MRACHGRAARPCASAEPEQPPAAGGVTGRERRHTGVVGEQRVGRPEPPRPHRPLHALARAARTRQRPAERVGGAHTRRRRPRTPRESHAARTVAMVGLEDRQLGVGVHAGAAEQRLLGAHERQILTGRAPLSRGQLGLAQRDRVLRQRQPRDDLPPARHCAVQVASIRRQPGAAGLGRRVARRQRQGHRVGPARVRRAPAHQREVAAEDFDSGAVLGCRTARGGGQAQRGGRAAEVAAQLAQVRHAGVDRENSA